MQKEVDYLKPHLHSQYKKSYSMKVEDMSPIDRLKSVKGEAFQGNYLVSAKERNSEKKYRGMSSSNSRMRYPNSSSKVEGRSGSTLGY